MKLKKIVDCYKIRYILSFSFSVPPMFWIPSQLEGAYVGQDTTLECHSEAHPKSINYWIKQDGSMLTSSEDKYNLCITYSFLSLT